MSIFIVEMINFVEIHHFFYVTNGESIEYQNKRKSKKIS
jgi:hypothetical protein